MRASAPGAAALAARTDNPPFKRFHDAAIAMNAVRMYTTQVCPFCLRAKALLKARGVQAIDEIRVDLDPQAREQMMSITGRRTVPQIFIGETHVGGCDELIALDASGGLKPLLGHA
jgi:glutaredoxin 3